MESKMRNRLVSILAACILGICSFAGCGAQRAQDPGDGQAQAGVQIVTTIFPEYDWVREILGENPAGAEVTMLLDNGVDLHSYQPTAADILKISTCDLFIYVGGESDKWVEDALQEATNKEMKVVNLLEALGEQVKEEELVEGMQEEHDHDNEAGEPEDIAGQQENGTGETGENGSYEMGEAGGEGHDEEIEYDEHVWLSLRNAETMCTPTIWPMTM